MSMHTTVAIQYRLNVGHFYVAPILVVEDSLLLPLIRSSLTFQGSELVLSRTEQSLKINDLSIRLSRERM